MAAKKRRSVLFALYMVFLILGTSNHCVFEELFFSITNKIFDSSKLHHLDNHLGSSSEHKHDNSRDPHEHGQPHSFVMLNTKKSAFDFVKLALLFFPLAFMSLLASRLNLTHIKALSTLACASAHQCKAFCQFIFSLTAAPQAPPVPA